MKIKINNKIRDNAFRNTDQIRVAVIGSCADQKEFEKNKNLCSELGIFLAQKNVIVLFSIENDIESIPTRIAEAAKQAGAKVVGFTHGNETEDNLGISDEVIVTSQPRGGPREHILISNADIVIGIGGGSGTLCEIAMAYQQKKRIILFRNTGGWSDKIGEEFLDGREKIRIEKVDDITGLALRMLNNVLI